jgi:hypothetical protein
MTRYIAARVSGNELLHPIPGKQELLETPLSQPYRPLFLFVALRPTTCTLHNYYPVISAILLSPAWATASPFSPPTRRESPASCGWQPAPVVPATEPAGDPQDRRTSLRDPSVQLDPPTCIKNRQNFHLSLPYEATILHRPNVPNPRLRTPSQTRCNSLPSPPFSPSPPWGLPSSQCPHPVVLTACSPFHNRP